MLCRKMQHRIVNLNMQNIQVFAKKSMLYKKKCNIVCVILPFLEVTILFNQHFIIVGNTVGKPPTGILNLFI